MVVHADRAGRWAHTIVASQTDTFGNTGTASLSFTLDTTADACADLAISTIEGGNSLVNAAEDGRRLQVAGLDADAARTLTLTDAATTP